MTKIALQENRSNAPPLCTADMVVQRCDGPRQLSNHDECMVRVSQQFTATLGRTRLSEHRWWIRLDSWTRHAIGQIVREDLALKPNQRHSEKPRLKSNKHKNTLYSENTRKIKNTISIIRVNSHYNTKLRSVQQKNWYSPSRRSSRTTLLSIK